MSARTTRLNHLVHLQCPRCYSAPLFLHHPYNLAGIGKMPKHCPHCHADFEPEPGFYFGALFISYAVAAPFCLLWFVLLNFGFGVAFEPALFLVAITQLLLTPYIFHFSRGYWLYFHLNSDAAVRKG
jgi:hypothetical protein